MTEPNTGVLNLDDLPLNDELKLFGLMEQAKYGDNNTDKPSWFDGITNRWKWQAWKDEGGKPKDMAQEQFIDKLVPILQDNQIDTSDPNEESGK